MLFQYFDVPLYLVLKYKKILKMIEKCRDIYIPVYKLDNDCIDMNIEHERIRCKTPNKNAHRYLIYFFENVLELLVKCCIYIII